MDGHGHGISRKLWRGHGYRVFENRGEDIDMDTELNRCPPNSAGNFYFIRLFESLKIEFAYFFIEMTYFHFKMDVKVPIKF